MIESLGRFLARSRVCKFNKVKLKYFDEETSKEDFLNHINNFVVSKNKQLPNKVIWITGHGNSENGNIPIG